MKKVIILLFFPLLFMSQGRFVFELKFKIDSTNREVVQSEIFNLDISNGKSFFYSQKYAKFDSISEANKSTGTRTKRPSPLLDYQIFKNYKDKTVTFKDMVGPDFFEVKEPESIKWKLLKDRKTIAGMPAQLATSNYKGRTWFAWFTKEIPISDGPYKFWGLPGLIVEIYDKRDDYHFTLIESMKTFREFSDSYLKSLGLKTLKTDYASYLKRKKEIDANPALTLTQMPGMDKIVLEKSDIDDFVKAYNAKKKLRNNNIELK